MSTEAAVGIAGAIVAGLVTALGILWKALGEARTELKASQEARISQADRHAADMEMIIGALKKRKEE